MEENIKNNNTSDELDSISFDFSDDIIQKLTNENHNIVDDLISTLDFDDLLYSKEQFPTNSIDGNNQYDYTKHKDIIMADLMLSSSAILNEPCGSSKSFVNAETQTDFVRDHAEKITEYFIQRFLENPYEFFNSLSFEEKK